MKKQRNRNRLVIKKRKHAGGEHSWAVSYVDMLTLLLCFFIIFFSFDKTPKIKEELSILDKITSHFNPNMGKGPGPGGSASHVVGDSNGTGKSLHDGKGENTQDGTFIAKGSADGKLKTCGAGSQGGGCGQGEGNGVGTGASATPTAAADKTATPSPGYAALGKMVQDRNQKVKAEVGSNPHPNLDQIESKLTNDKLQVKFKQKAIVIEFPSVSFFSSGSTSLNKDGMETVNYLISVITPFKDKVKIRVQGHTDPRPLSVKKYNYSDNWELSVLRATSVLKVFLQNQFTPDQLAAEGFADTQRTIASTDQNLANLRRITLLIEEK